MTHTILPLILDRDSPAHHWLWSSPRPLLEIAGIWHVIVVFIYFEYLPMT